MFKHNSTLLFCNPYVAGMTSISLTGHITYWTGPVWTNGYGHIVLENLHLLPQHNGMNNTAERDLTLQNERLALLVHHVDWRDQFTFVLPLTSSQAYLRPAVYVAKPALYSPLQVLAKRYTGLWCFMAHFNNAQGIF